MGIEQVGTELFACAGHGGQDCPALASLGEQTVHQSGASYIMVHDFPAALLLVAWRYVLQPFDCIALCATELCCSLGWSGPVCASAFLSFSGNLEAAAPTVRTE